MDSPKIRLINENDISSVAKIYAKAFNKVAPDEDWTQQSAEDLMKYLFKKQADLFFIAQIDDKIVGGAVAIVKPLWNGNNLVESELFVDPDYWKNGIGTKLLKKFLTEAIEKYNVVDLHGIADGRTDFPMKWYSKIGLNETGWLHVEGDAREILKNLH